LKKIKLIINGNVESLHGIDVDFPVDLTLIALQMHISTKRLHMQAKQITM
jgi:hypothetical protein